MRINFSPPDITELEINEVVEALKSGWITTGPRTKELEKKIAHQLGTPKSVCLNSATAALEMSLRVLGIGPGDEVITSAYSYTASASPVVHVGATLVLVDTQKDAYEMDYDAVARAITPKTKAIYAVDYAGFPCEMDKINEIANRHGLFVIEDAAQAVGSTYKGRYAGTLTEFGCFSFHETKNYVMGEGGAIVVNEDKYMERAEIIREKGTNRRNVLRGLVDKYTWHDIGSSFLPSDLLAAILSAQMERYDEILEKRMNVWNTYYNGLECLEKEGLLRRPVLPEDIEHNAHMFCIVLPDEDTRTNLINSLKEKGISSYICYVPLHSSPYGQKLGYTPEMLPVTEDLGKRILRLPLYVDMTTEDTLYVVDEISKSLKRG